MATKKLNGESYTCTTKGDKVICESGTNQVKGNIGNDKIYGGSGADTVIINYNSDYGFGKDTLYNLTKTDTLKFSTSSWDAIDEVVKSGNNLVFNSYAYKNGKITNKVLDRVVVADYFKADKGKSINEKDRLTKFMNGSSTLDVEIDVALKGTQNLGKGKFNLNTKKSNSKVVLDKTATANIVFEPETMVSHNKDYSKLVVKRQLPHDGYFIKKGNDLTMRYDNLTINVNKEQEKVSAKTNSITFADYFTTDTTQTSGRGNSNISINNINYKIDNSSYTLKELIEDCGILITASDLKEGDLYRFDSINKSVIDTNYMVQGSKKGDRITLNNTKVNIVDSRGGNDVVHSEKNNSITTFLYSGGADNYIAGKYNDSYAVGATIKSFENKTFKNVGFTKKSCLLINDKGGTDEMLISAKTKDLRLFFDVNSNGEIVVSEKMDFLRSDGKIWDSLLIFNKSALSGKNIQSMMKKGSFTGAVEMDNYFATGTSSSSAVSTTTRGAGCIENIETKDSDDKLDMQTWINKIAGDVASWLKENKYSTAGEVLLKDNNSKDINALIAIYNKDTYAAAIK